MAAGVLDRIYRASIIIHDASLDASTLISFHPCAGGIPVAPRSCSDWPAVLLRRKCSVVVYRRVSVIDGGISHFRLFIATEPCMRSACIVAGFNRSLDVLIVTVLALLYVVGRGEIIFIIVTQTF